MEIKYVLYRNEMPATRDSAPYLARVIPNGVVNKLQLTDDVTATEFLTSTTCDSATAAIRTKAIELILDGWTVEFGGVNFRANISGSFDTEDGTWDLDRNAIEIIAEPTDALRNALAYVTPTLARGDLSSLIRFSTEMDVTTNTFSTVIGTNIFRIAGNLLTMDGEDEYVKAYPADGSEPLAATILRVEDGQRAECRFEPPLAPGKYRLEIATHGLIAEPSLRIFRQSVTAKPAPAPKMVIRGATSCVNPWTIHGPSGSGQFRLEGENILCTGAEDEGLWFIYTDATGQEVVKYAGPDKFHESAGADPGTYPYVMELDLGLDHNPPGGVTVHGLLKVATRAGVPGSELQIFSHACDWAED